MQLNIEQILSISLSSSNIPAAEFIWEDSKMESEWEKSRNWRERELREYRAFKLSPSIKPSCPRKRAQIVPWWRIFKAPLLRFIYIHFDFLLNHTTGNDNLRSSVFPFPQFLWRNSPQLLTFFLFFLFDFLFKLYGKCDSLLWYIEITRRMVI